MKVKFYTYPDKRPDFILRQKSTLDFFVKDNFEYIVINNGSSSELKKEIQEICNNNNITHYFVENPDHSNPTIACSYPINQSLNKFIKQDKNTDISVIIDSDMFFIKHFSVSDFVNEYEIAAIKQIRGDVNYIWNGIVFINHNKIKDIQQLDFGFQQINGKLTDVGGNMYFYFKKHPDCRLRNILHTSHITGANKNLKVLPKYFLEKYDIDFCFEIIEKSILHYGRGSNWDKMPLDYHKNKTKFLDEFLDSALKNEIEWTDFEYVFDYDCWKK